MSQTLPKSNSIPREQNANIQQFVTQTGSQFIPIMMSARNISSSNQFSSNTTTINTVHPSTLLLSTATNASNSVQISEHSGLSQGVRSQPPLAVRVLSTGNSQSASQLLQKPRTPFSSTGVAQVINGPLNTKLLSGNAETKLLIHKQPTVNQPTGPNLLPLNAINSSSSASSDPAKLVSTANLIPISATNSASRVSAANPPLGLIYATPAPNVLSSSINPQTAGSVLIGSNSGKTLVTLPSMGSKGLTASAPVATLVKPTVIRGIPLAHASSLSTPTATPPATKSSSGNDSSTAGNSPGNETPNTTPGRAHSPSQSSTAVNRKRSRKQALSHHQPSEQHSNSSTPPPSALPGSPSPPPPASNASSRAVATANIFMMSNAAIMADKSKTEGDSLIKENGVSLVASSSSASHSMIPLKLIPVRTGAPCTVTSSSSVQPLMNTSVKSLGPHYTNGLFVVAHAQHPATIIPTTSVESAQPADSLSTIILTNSSSAGSQPVVSISNLEAALSQNSTQSGVYQLKYRAGDIPNAQSTPAVATLLTPALDSPKNPIAPVKSLASLETPPNQGQKPENWHPSAGSASTLSSSPTSSMHALNAAATVLSRAAQDRASRASYESSPPRVKSTRQYSSVSSSSSACDSLEGSIVLPRAPAQVVPQKPAYARFIKSGHFLKYSDVRLKTPTQSELGYAFSWLNEPNTDDDATNGSSGIGPRRGGGDFNLRKRPVPSAMGQLINASRPAKAPRKAVMNYIQETGMGTEPEEHPYSEESMSKRLEQGLINTVHSPASSQDALHIAPILQGGACSYESYCMWHYLIELRDQHSVTQYVRNPLATTSSLDLTGWRLLHSANGLFQLYDSERNANSLSQTLEKRLSLMLSIGKGGQKGQVAQGKILDEQTRKKAEKTLEMVKAFQQRNQLMLSKLEDFYKRSHGLVERHRFPALQLFDDLGRLLEPLEQEPLEKHSALIRGASVNGAVSDVLCEEAEMELETSPGMWPRLMHSMTYSESVASSCESTGLGSHKTMEVPVTEPPKDTSVLDDPLQRPNRRKDFIASAISSANISRTSSPTANPLAAALLSSRKFR